MIYVDKKVFEGLEFVRLSGKTNMFDFHAVQRLAFESDFYATVSWMEENKDKYLRGIGEGIEPKEEEDG